jgi:hypothetical protein
MYKISLSQKGFIRKKGRDYFLVAGFAMFKRITHMRETVDCESKQVIATDREKKN